MAEISLTLSFMLLLLIVYRPTTRAIAKMLDNKSELMDQCIYESENLRNTANNALIRAKTSLVEAELLAEQIRSHAMLSAKTIKDNAEAKLEDVKNRKKKSALVFLEYKKRQYALQLKDALLDEAIRSIRHDVESRIVYNDDTSEALKKLSGTIKRFTLH